MAWKAGFHFPQINWPWQLPAFPSTNSEVGNFCVLNRGSGRNKIPDKGNPGTVETNRPGTTKKKYGSDGWVEKEWNKGHPDHPKGSLEHDDHIHDHIPDPKNPKGKPKRQSGRKPADQDKKDFGI